MTETEIFELLNESVKPLIVTVINYFDFTEHKSMTDDQLAAIAALNIALKNWERIEQEFLAKKDMPISILETQANPDETRRGTSGKTTNRITRANFRYNR